MSIKSVKQSARESLVSYSQFYEEFLRGNVPNSDIKIQQRKTHFHKLIDCNLKFLQHKLGNDMRKQIEKDKLNITKYLEINEEICIKLFGQELFDVIKRKNRRRLNSIHRKIEKESMQGRFRFAQSLIGDKNYIAIVAIRPELMYVSNLVKNFLYANDFDIIYSKKKIFTPMEFFIIYKDLLDTYPDYYKLFPTMIMIFTGNESEILFVKKTVAIPFGKSLPEDISNKYKGLTGRAKKYIMKKNTIRTDILYREYVIASRLLGNNLEMALDPLRIIKSTVQGLGTQLQLTPIVTDDPYIPYLTKTQGGVHIPTSLGIGQYMAMSFTKDELLDIKSVI